MRATTIPLLSFLALASSFCVPQESADEPRDNSEPPLVEEPANYAATDTCEVFPQAGCPSTHTCQVATVSGATVCEGAGVQPHSGYCQSNGDCAPGLSCLANTCRQYCSSPGDCPGSAPTCHQITGSGDQPIPGLALCSVSCNPADPHNTAADPGFFACHGNEGCLPLQHGASQGSTECYSAGNIPLGGDCSNADCQGGLVCLSDGSGETCRPFCLMGWTNCSCLPFNQTMHVAMPDGSVAELGYCS